MKVVISIYKTNADGSNSLYMVSQECNNDSVCKYRYVEFGEEGTNYYGCSKTGIPCNNQFDFCPKVSIKHYGWRHEFPEEELLKDALDLIWEATRQP